MHQHWAPTCTQYSHFLQIQRVNSFLSCHWQGSVSSPSHTDPFLPSGLSLSFEDDFEGEFRSRSSPTTSYNCLQVESGLRFQQIASFQYVMLCLLKAKKEFLTIIDMQPQLSNHPPTPKAVNSHLNIFVDIAFFFSSS